MTAVSARPAAARTQAIGVLLCGAAALAGTVVILASLAAFPGANDGWLHAARYTARLSFLFFVPVFFARAWNQLAPSAASRWALRNRRYLGLAFATAHFVHLFALTRFNVATDQVPDTVTLVGGGGAYVFIAAMAATSNDWSVRTLGARNWKRLHAVGIFWIWGVFTFSYFGRVAEGQLFFLPFFAIALAGLALRLYVRVLRRGQTPS
jgi:DMSO/TMAO reductase YedYZ heme-binding membrane subunit